MKWFSLFAVLILFFNNCSNDPVSSGEDQPPSMPDLYSFQSEPISFFDYEVDHTDEDYSYPDYIGFYVARTWAQLALDRGTYDFFPFAAQAEPEFEDGVWVWEFPLTDVDNQNEPNDEQEGDEAFRALREGAYLAKSSSEVTQRLTARSLSGGTEWALTISGTIDGTSINNILIEGGYVSDDGREGQWNYYLPDFEGDGSSIYKESEWELGPDSEVNMHVTQYWDDYENPGVIKTRIYHYTRSGEDNRLTTNDGHDIYWNLETGQGWAFNEGEKICFSSENDYKNVPCAD